MFKSMKSHRELSESVRRVPLKRSTSPTCVVEGGPSVNRRSTAGLDEPLGVRPCLSVPTAERREVKVAGEPNVRCDRKKRAGGHEFVDNIGFQLLSVKSVIHKVNFPEDLLC